MVKISQIWWCKPLISALWEAEAAQPEQLSDFARPCLTRQNKTELELWLSVKAPVQSPASQNE